MTARSIAIAGAFAAAAAILAGCSGEPAAEPYVFDPAKSPVDVDTPALRAQKAEAGIEPCPKTAARPSTAAEALPDVTLPCLGGGRSVDISRLRGPLVVNFWAQNCPACLDESPAIQQVYQAFGGRLGVIGVDWQDTQPALALSFAHDNGITYPQLADPVGATRAALQIRGLPVTVFVKRDGSIAYVNPGPISSPAELRKLVRQYLGVQAGGES